MQNRVIGIIGGQGWMGRALGLSLLEQGVVPPERLLVSSHSGSGTAYRAWERVRVIQSNAEVVELADIVVLAVRPEDLGNIDINADGKLVISLLAMVSLQAIADAVGSRRVVRAMPNAAAEIRRAYFPWFASQQISDGDKRLVQELLESSGKAREVPAERDLDYLTAVSGAGPAYPALLAQTMLEHAKKMGIADDIALEAVMETLVGGSLLLEKQAGEPGDMVDRLIAYNGTTAKGLQTMINEGFRQATQRGLEAAFLAASGSR